MPRGPVSEAQRQFLRENLARGRATRSARLAAGLPSKKDVAAAQHKQRIEEAIAAEAQAAAQDAERAPTTAIENNPDFNAAVEKAIADRLPAMLATIAQANGHAQGQSPESFANALSLQLAKLTGQGTGKQYVDPEELEKRAGGRKEMMRLIRECHETGEVPAYRIIRQTQLNVPPFGPIVIEPVWRGADRVERDTEIDFPWIPNLAMVPLNDAAKRIFAQFEIWVAAEMPEVADPEWALIGPAQQAAAALGREPIRARSEPLGSQYALNQHTGMVVRGAAAAAIIRNDPALRDLGPQNTAPMHPYQAAMIRRGEDPAVRKKQVLGTLTDPIEMR